MKENGLDPHKHKSAHSDCTGKLIQTMKKLSMYQNVAADVLSVNHQNSSVRKITLAVGLPCDSKERVLTDICQKPYSET